MLKIFEKFYKIHIKKNFLKLYFSDGKQHERIGPTFWFGFIGREEAGSYSKRDEF